MSGYLILLSPSLLFILVGEARAISVKRSPGGPVVRPPGHNDPHTPNYTPGSAFKTNGQRKRAEAVPADHQDRPGRQDGLGQPRIEKRNIFSQLLDIDRDSHHLPHLYKTYLDHHRNSVANDNNDWVDENDNQERHEKTDEDDENEYRDLISIESLDDADTSTPVVIEPSLHPTLESLFDSHNNDNKHNNLIDQDREQEGNIFGSNYDDEDDNDNEIEVLNRMQASYPWPHLHHPSLSSPSSSSSSGSEDPMQHVENILKSQIWIIDEWDEDFDVLDDLIDWIEDVDHVRAPTTSSTPTRSPFSRFFS
ncbi:hypothetical protein FBU30_004991 [Linnemannia zychae]|nr:hypothetical protein FBU30_004991 [Linnemannia zychae]